MRENLEKRCQLFIHNRDMIKASMGFESAYVYPLCAEILTARNIAADVNTLKNCTQILKSKTGAFSYFRGTSKLVTIVLLSISADPEIMMDHMVSLYTKLKKIFYSSEYLTVAAASIAEMAEPGQYDAIIKRAGELYRRMKQAHPFLTSSDDSAFAALLAMSDFEDSILDREMEACYNILKSHFFSAGAVQSLSQVLTLGLGTADQKCRRALELFEGLKSRGYKYGTGYELATLGMLALLDVDKEILIGDIIDTDEYLKRQKGFGVMGVGAKQRLMYAGMLAALEYTPDLQPMQTAAQSGIVALIIAQEAAICASVAAVCISTSTSNS